MQPKELLIGYISIARFVANHTISLTPLSRTAVILPALSAQQARLGKYPIRMNLSVRTHRVVCNVHSRAHELAKEQSHIATTRKRKPRVWRGDPGQGVRDFGPIHS